MVQHCDDDTLTLMALGESMDNADEAHVQHCARCQSRVDQLAAVVATVRSLKMQGGKDKKQLTQEDLPALEKGFQAQQIQESAYRTQRAIERGDQVVVGVNRFRDEGVATPPLQRIDPAGERRQVESLRRVRAERDPVAWAASLERLEAAARSGENVMPPLIEAVKAYATVGEISDRLRALWGEYREVITV